MEKLKSILGMSQEKLQSFCQQRWEFGGEGGVQQTYIGEIAQVHSVLIALGGQFHSHQDGE